MEASTIPLATLSEPIVWSTVLSVRVVGIQSSFRHYDFTWAKNWWAVAQLLEQVDERLLAKFERALIGLPLPDLISSTKLSFRRFGGSA